MTGEIISVRTQTTTKGSILRNFVLAEFFIDLGQFASDIWLFKVGLLIQIGQGGFCVDCAALD
jgi:hypothetical protein